MKSSTEINVNIRRHQTKVSRERDVTGHLPLDLLEKRQRHVKQYQKYKFQKVITTGSIKLPYSSKSSWMLSLNLFQRLMPATVQVMTCRLFSRSLLVLLTWSPINIKAATCIHTHYLSYHSLMGILPSHAVMTVFDNNQSFCRNHV